MSIENVTLRILFLKSFLTDTFDLLCLSERHEDFGKTNPLITLLFHFILVTPTQRIKSLSTTILKLKKNETRKKNMSKLFITHKTALVYNYFARNHVTVLVFIN